MAAVAVVGGGTDDGFEVAQRNGITAWSRLAGDRFQLVARRNGGRPRVLPVASSPTPFELEIGHDRTGRFAVAFSRCETEGSVEEALFTRRRCRLGIVSPDGGRERPLGPPPARGYSHLRPQLQGGRLGYVRIPDRGGRAEVVVDGEVVFARDGVSGPGGVRGLDLARYGVATVLLDE